MPKTYSKSEAFILFMQNFCAIPVTSQKSNSGKVIGPNSLWTVFYFEPIEETATIADSTEFDDFYA